jgi:hypothetical protein
MRRKFQRKRLSNKGLDYGTSYVSEDWASKKLNSIRD